MKSFIMLTIQQSMLVEIHYIHFFTVCIHLHEKLLSFLCDTILPKLFQNDNKTINFLKITRHQSAKET